MNDRAPTKATLLPCPFCGGEPRQFNCVEPDGFVSGTFVRCDACGIDINDEYEADAIAAWNRRASPPAPAAEPVAYLRAFYGPRGIEVSVSVICPKDFPVVNDRTTEYPLYTHPLDAAAIRAEARKAALEEAAAWHDDQAALHDAQGDACGTGSDGWKRHTVAAADHRRSATSVRALADKGEAE
ncbi:Lar family restriction alleviation protein [Ancylobacter polymorphus]|uniref:Lar family restriction alleviation protein n=1 Tax=Ancylobacter polymorphus TaxID=223390 RepID=A0A9E7A1Y5_9HYPH|nr:Lar family restriction alleviation protein [Ancylobacter polymorphus]UOK71665.1 Lar family restriction alleviation protein [Ancylobacter polymorphus]